MAYLLARLSEPSTWASIAALIAGVSGVTMSPGVVQNLTMAGTGIAGLLGILLKEKGV